MIEGRPRQSLVLYDPPYETQLGGVDPFAKSGGKVYSFNLLKFSILLFFNDFLFFKFKY